jgi:carboxyl-terminal processing protease
LAGQPRVAWTQRYRTPHGFSEEVYAMRLEPASSVGFKGPVVVLISNNTVSAGEELPLLLEGLPNVTLVGERTPGALSDIQMKALPDGGLFGLPNQMTLSATGATYDGRGIPPEVGMIVFEARAALTGYAAVIAKAASIARSKAAAGKQ